MYIYVCATVAPPADLEKSNNWRGSFATQSTLLHILKRKNNARLRRLKPGVGVVLLHLIWARHPRAMNNENEIRLYYHPYLSFCLKSRHSRTALCVCNY